MKRCHEIIEFRYGHLTFDLANQVVNQIAATNDSNYNMHRSKVFDWGRTVQRDTLIYLVEAVFEMMSETGGEAVWRAKSEDEVKGMLLAQFDEFPMIITQLAFHHANNSIAFEELIVGSTASTQAAASCSQQKALAIHAGNARSSGEGGRLRVASGTGQ